MAIFFKRLTIEGWRQFEEISIELHPRLTIITGANGAGKSTLLSLFSRHFGWNKNYLSTPIREKSGSISYVTDVIAELWHKLKAPRPTSGQIQIGEISYSNNVKSPITLASGNHIQYNLNIAAQQPVTGMHIDAYRPTPNYSPVANVPLQPMTSMQAYHNYNSEVINGWTGGYTGSSPTFRLKEAIMAMAIFGEGNSIIGRNEVLLKTFKGFNEILENILPESLGFRHLSVRSPEVVMVTKSGEFMLDAASGGISTLLDIAWRIYMFSHDQPNFSVTIDEPENHLHPSMQRTLLRKLLLAFPQVQFIVATHSPFIVSSVKDSYVYVLRYQAENKKLELPNEAPEALDVSSRVKSIFLEKIDKAGSANEILREVLGVSATMPEWVEDQLKIITSQFVGKTITKELLGDLRQQLKEIGYAEYFPEALSKLEIQ